MGPRRRASKKHCEGSLTSLGDAPEDDKVETFIHLYPFFQPVNVSWIATMYLENQNTELKMEKGENFLVIEK